MPRPARWPLPAILAAVVSVAPASSQQQVTLETLTDRSFSDAISTPTYAWLEDGTALLHDRRLPPAERTIERLEPESGRRSRAVDAAKALASLASVMDAEDGDPPESLAWPDELHRSGGLAVYSIADDLFLLDLRTSTFRRLTRSPGEEEKNPQISPDASRVSFVRGSDLYVIELASGAEHRLTRDGSDTLLNGTLSWVYWEEIFGREDLASWWSPDSASIAFLQSDESMVDVAEFLKFEPATPEVVRQRYPKAGGRNPRVRLGIIDLATGGITWANLGDPAPEYLARVVWMPEGSRVAVETLDRAQRRMNLVLVDRTTGAGRTVLTETSATSLNIHDDLRFLNGGHSFLWASERDGHNHIYLYESDGTLVRLLTPGDIQVSASSGLAWVRGGVVGVDEKGGWVYFTAVDGVPVAPALYRASLGGGAVERMSRGDGTHQVGLDPGARYVLDRFANGSTPPGLFLQRADGSPRAVVTPPASAFLAPYRLQTPTFFTIPADDGFPLPAQMARPRDFDPARKYPVIVYVYGGPSAPVVRNDWQRYTYWDNLLLDHGFICVAVDNRSATGLSKTLEDTSFGRLMSAYEVPDLVSAVRWLKAQPYVDAARIGVWGWSGGGTFTLQLMTHSKEFKAGIAVAAVTDFRYYDTVWTERVLGLPEDNPQGYRDGAPASAAAQLAGSLLLMHGTSDDNVHPQNAWRFARELQRGKIPFAMMMYPLEKHGLRGVSAHVYRTMLDFWLRALAAGAPPPVGVP